MARGHGAGQAGQHLAIGKDLGNMAKAAMRIEFAPVEAGNAHRFLPAVLQGVKAKRGYARRILDADHAENAALLAQLVAVTVKKRVSKVHGFAPGSAKRRFGPSWPRKQGERSNR